MVGGIYIDLEFLLGLPFFLPRTLEVFSGKELLSFYFPFSRILYFDRFYSIYFVKRDA